MMVGQTTLFRLIVDYYYIAWIFLNSNPNEKRVFWQNSCLNLKLHFTSLLYNQQQ